VKVFTNPAEKVGGWLRAVEERRILGAPRVELDALPAGGKVTLEDRQGFFELSAAEHVRVEVPAAMRVRSEDPPTEHALYVFERLDVPAMQLDLERWLPPIPGERAFGDDQTHRIPDIKGVHWAKG
jgi:hypothetical protein